MPHDDYRAPPGLGNPHVQTIVASLARRHLIPKRAAAFVQSGDDRIFEIGGVKLLASLHLRDGAPMIMIIPGWLGSASSAYVISAAQALYAAGFSVCRVNLRDHGDTAHLNRELFHSARIEEVVALAAHVFAEHSHGHAGLIGYSLGGNFALRVARRLPDVTTLAVCPALSPRDTMDKIESNSIYRRYFVGKWRRVFSAKQTAYPNDYDFGQVMQLSTISAMTDYFVKYHTEFVTTEDYFRAYDLTGSALEGVSAHVLAARDDPIIPALHYDALPTSLELTMVPQGGHGAFLTNWQLESWADRYAVEFFS